MLAQIEEDDRRSAAYKSKGRSLAESDPLLPFYIFTGFAASLCVVVFSILLPLKFDLLVDYRWTDVFVPVHILLIGIPLFSGLVVITASFLKSRGHEMGGATEGGFVSALAPYEGYPISKPKFWLEVLLYVLPMALFSVFLSEALDDAMDLSYFEIGLPLLVGFCLGAVFHLVLKEWKKFVFDVLIVAFVTCVVLKLGDEDSKLYDSSWFAVMIPVWLLDLMGPFVLVRYVLRSNHMPMRKAVTSGIILSFLIPMYVFQILLAHRLDGSNRMNWINVFIPVFVTESVLLGPFMLLCMYLFIRFFCNCLLGPKETGISASAADDHEKQSLID